MGKFRFLEFQDDDIDDTNKGDQEFAALLESDASNALSARTGFRTAEKVTGTVLHIGKESVFIDIGSKLTGTIARSEFNESLPETGSLIELYVKSVTGSEVLLTKVLKTESTGVEELLQAKEALTPVEAKIEKVVNGGFQAKLGSHRAFIPISHMELYSKPGQPSPLDKPEDYVGKSFSFHVLEVKEGGKNILLSRRTLLKEDQDETSRKTLQELKEGETRTATITKLMPFGAFAQLGPGIEGLIPMGELGWKRVTKAADVVTEGESVQVKIVSITHSPKLRISLSMKDAGTDPWLVAETRLKPSDSCTGKVTRVADFGAFVEVDEGIEGLVHISELSWTKRIRHPGDILRPGQTETFTVLKMEPQERRLSLSLRGPMPEELKNKAKAMAAERNGEMSAEDREIMDAWKIYQAQQSAQASSPRDTHAHTSAQNSASGSMLAEAFASARARKKS